MHHKHKLNLHWATTDSGALVLTWSPQEEKHSYPVDPEEHEAHKGPEGL